MQNTDNWKHDPTIYAKSPSPRDEGECDFRYPASGYRCGRIRKHHELTDFGHAFVPPAPSSESGEEKCEREHPSNPPCAPTPSASESGEEVRKVKPRCLFVMHDGKPCGDIEGEGARHDYNGSGCPADYRHPFTLAAPTPSASLREEPPPASAEKWPERTYFPIPKNGIEWAIDFFEYRDRMNAQIHCQTPTWSPITVQIRADYAQAAQDRAKVLAVEKLVATYRESPQGAAPLWTKFMDDLKRALAGEKAQ